MPILTLTTGRTSEIAPHGRCGLVCETASDGSFRARFPGAIGFNELFGDVSEARRRAANLASRLVKDEPPIGGIQQLRVFEEVMIGEIEAAFLALNLRDWMRANRFERCALLEDCWLTSVIDVVAAEKDIVVQLPTAGKSSRTRTRAARMLARAAQSKFLPSALQQEIRQFLDHFDPYHRRSGLYKRSRNWRAGDIWYYTTAQTFTNVGLAYEPYFPAQFNFLVENPARGGAPLKAIGRQWTSPYEFSAATLAPSRSEVADARRVIAHHLNDVRLSGAEQWARESFAAGGYFEEFCQRLLPLGLYHTRLFDEWVRQTRPAALVVGNFVFEAYALLAARRHGIPTILLQHGTMGEGAISDVPADHYILRGKFWQGFLTEAARHESKVLNVPVNPMPALPGTRQSILFLTAPYSMQRVWTESDLDDILATLLRCAAQSGAELIVRVHPIERVGYYRHRIERIMTGVAKIQQVTYSQGGSLDNLLARSVVAVTFSSTAFLDCLRWKIPIVSFGWHDFEYKESIRDRGVFHFADDLSELRDLVLRAISGTLPPFREGMEPFLASTPEAQLRQGIEHMIGAAPRSIPAPQDEVAEIHPVQ